MDVDLGTVRRVFEDVLSGSMSREQADRWAYAVVHEEEAGVVTYSPAHERERIWDGVIYLYGVDAMKAPGEYLHSDGDIRAAMKAKLDEAVDPEEGQTPAGLGQRSLQELAIQTG